MLSIIKDTIFITVTVLISAVGLTTIVSKIVDYIFNRNGEESEETGIRTIFATFLADLQAEHKINEQQCDELCDEFEKFCEEIYGNSLNIK